MSSGIKTIASIALPIVGSAIGGPIGGAIGGAIGGGINGGIPGAVLGAVGGYAGAGGVNSIIGNVSGAPLSEVTGIAGLQGPTQGSGILGAVTGGGVRALASGVSSAASGITSGGTGALSAITGIGNNLLAQEQADDAKKAAGLQSASVDKAIAATQPYNQFGQDAINQIGTIQADPAGYIKNNPLYTSLADQASRTLLANQAAKGKVGSGGTAAALQDQLLQIGNGLVQQQVGTLQRQVDTGAGATANTANLLTQQGNAQAAGVIGQGAAYRQGYNNDISTLLALQNLNKTPTYAPMARVNV